jgi:23S rRNA (pseudouridine1915-N3)-methyltransferase
VRVKLGLCCVGKLKEEAERAIVRRYLERFAQIGAGLGFTWTGVAELMESRAASAGARKTAEAAELMRRVPPDSRIIALDERGRTFSSEEFAETLRRWQAEGVRSAVLLIGGPDGLDPTLVENAALSLSLGRMTLPHGLARAVLAEQLYRAATIIARHPYHRV